MSAAAANQVALLTGLGIIAAKPPIREVRFTDDGGVHDLFTIVGLPGAPSACNVLQPDFQSAKAAGTMRFRIPTPVFGAGLIEAIEHATIAANEVIFSGEAYNLEQGITDGLFPDERGERGIQDAVACHQVVAAPQDTVNYELTEPQQIVDTRPPQRVDDDVVSTRRPRCDSRPPTCSRICWFTTWAPATTSRGPRDRRAVPHRAAVERRSAAVLPVRRQQGQSRRRDYRTWR